MDKPPASSAPFRLAILADLDVLDELQNVIVRHKRRLGGELAVDFNIAASLMQGAALLWATSARERQLKNDDELFLRVATETYREVRRQMADA